MSIFINPTFLMGSAFLAFVMQVFFDLAVNISSVPMLEEDNTKTVITTRNLNILQSHPMCGVTFDKGREECWWNCSKETSVSWHWGFFEVISMKVCIFNPNGII